MVIKGGKILRKDGRPKASVLDKEPKRKKHFLPKEDEEIEKVIEEDGSPEVVKARKKVKKLDRELSEQLTDCSEIDLSFNSNAELLRKLRIALLNATKICDGAYRTRPTQGNAYAFSNLISNVRDITKQIEDTLDYESISATLCDEVIKSFLDRMLLNFGASISARMNKIENPKKKEFLKKEMKEILHTFGVQIKTEYGTLQQSVTEHLLNSTK